MVEEKYQRIIAQCIARRSDLTDWENGFIENIGKFHTLSFGQKKILDRIVTTRFEGGKAEKSDNIDFGFVSGVKTDQGYVVTVDGNQVGKGFIRKEIALINIWLKDAIVDLFQLIKDDKIAPPDQVEREVQEVIESEGQPRKETQKNEDPF